MLDFQIILSDIAGPEIMLACFLILVAILFLKNHKRDSILILLSAFLATGTAYGLKFLLKIPRPLDMLINETGYRFPSGHATMAGVITGLIFYYTHTKVKNIYLRCVLYILGIIWLVLVSYSRLYLNVHLFIDVLAGAFIGLSAVIIISKIVIKRLDNLLKKDIISKVK